MQKELKTKDEFIKKMFNFFIFTHDETAYCFDTKNPFIITKSTIVVVTVLSKSSNRFPKRRIGLNF